MDITTTTAIIITTQTITITIEIFITTTILIISTTTIVIITITILTTIPIPKEKRGKPNQEHKTKSGFQTHKPITITKQKQKQKKQQSNESILKFNLNELGYKSDDSIIDDLINTAKNNKEEEKHINLEEDIDDDENGNLQQIGIGNNKRNINRQSLYYDRATSSWYDKKDKFYKFKKLFNSMARSNEINYNTSELPKIIIKNVEAVNWSYSDVYECLEEFIKEMKRLGHDTWSQIESDDIVDYRIHIPYNVIPKGLVEKQSEQQQQQLEQENNNNRNGKMEIDMIGNKQSIELDQWVQTLLEKVENKNVIRCFFFNWCYLKVLYSCVLKYIYLLVVPTPLHRCQYCCNMQI